MFHHEGGAVAHRGPLGSSASELGMKDNSGLKATSPVC